MKYEDMSTHIDGGKNEHHDEIDLIHHLVSPKAVLDQVGPDQMYEVEIEAEVKGVKNGFLQPVPYSIRMYPCRVYAELGRDEYEEAAEVDNAEQGHDGPLETARLLGVMHEKADPADQNAHDALYLQPEHKLVGT